MPYRCGRCGSKTATSPIELCWRCAGFERLTPHQSAYLEAVAALKLDSFAHCDDKVLHARALCRYCAMGRYDQLHELRRRLNIAYSGAALQAGQDPCPSEAWRPPDLIERWPGNRAEPIT